MGGLCVLFVVQQVDLYLFRLALTGNIKTHITLKVNTQVTTHSANWFFRLVTVQFIVLMAVKAINRFAKMMSSVR